MATPGQPGTQCTFQSVGIAHTADAAGNWEQFVIGALPGSSGPSELVRQCKGGLVFADPQHGFLGAWDPNGPPVIYRTNDAGRSWNASSPLPDPPGFTTRPAVGALRAGRVHAFGATLLVVASGEATGRGVSFVYRSVDGGASWRYAVTLPDTLGAFAFVSESRWLQIAPAGSSKETTDGGATWHVFTTDFAQSAPVTPEIVFGDALVGYATVRGTIQRTLDGGAHWVGIKTPGT